ncbi:ABC transporter ATP-binding protein [Alicyclobacillus cellulosilyticus]|uniref:ABC transporter ATP-binding protein n=1 Tax=Alicyclobacillus cellulosilyticus TaxID=1003997 RepID=A0A917K4D3_9BACL|nr:ABC transporter ATP-binding protein [Alicyclobacillus cellulosilyticus]GGI98550.1 ABC transporter ATP-binding protein [Alicyclobacillus cellulosilyticus]
MVKLLRFLHPYRFLIPVELTMIFLQSLANLYLPTLMSDIVDFGIVKGNVPYIFRMGTWMLLVTVGGAACSVLGSLLASRISAGFGHRLRAEVFAHVTRFSLQEFDHVGTASLITRTTNDVTQVQQMVNMMLRMMVMAPLSCIGGIIMAVVTNAKLSVIIVIVVPVLAFTVAVIFRRGMAWFRQMQAKIDQLNRVLRENLTGIRVIRAFNRIEHERRRFDAASRDLTETAVTVNKIMAALWPVMMLIINFATIAILWFGAVRIDHGAMQVGNLMAFLQYVMQIFFAIMMVSMMSFMIPRASASAARIQEVLALRPAVADPPQAAEPVPAVATRPSAPDAVRLAAPYAAEVPARLAAPHAAEVPARHGVVTFEGVTFRYPGAEAPALAGITFTASPGEVTAIIGSTGAGKTTLVHLLLRFYDAERGSIRIDGVDVRDMKQADLRRRIAYVPQRTVLFSGSVADNVRYGKEDATDDEVRAALAMAQAIDFVEAMEGGIHAEVAQAGTNLSGGQKQRIAIARALVRNADIYVFDDSFSALDYKTDARLRQAIRQALRGATVIIVAQRVATVMDADQIIVLDEGRMAGIGRHAELLATCPVYREIVASQLAGEGIA